MSLVPTRVGMILIIGCQAVGLKACPHTRGDDPEYTLAKATVKGLSPHAWG